MTTISLQSPAKINLHLEVSTALTDGKHELRSLYCALDLHDKIQIEFIPHAASQANSGIAISTTFTTQDKLVHLPHSRQNSIIAAVKLFYKYYNILPKHQLKIQVDKCIPSQAGLAGGSSNAATVLQALFEFHQLDSKGSKAVELAAQIGSDVPFFLHRQTSLWGGFGELHLQDYQLSTPLAIALIKPGFGVSTVRAYALFDELNNFMRISNTGFNETQHLMGDFSSLSTDQQHTTDISSYYLAHKPFNSLQQSAFELRPALLDLYNQLESTVGVLQAQISGSGSTIFCICQDLSSAQQLATDYASKNYWTWAGLTLTS